MGERRRGQFIVSCGCIHWEFFTSFLPTSVNYTNRFRRGNVSFWKLFLKEKRKQQTRVQIFRLSLATSLTFSHQHPMAARRMPVRQQRQSGESSCKKSRCDFFFFNDMSLLNIKSILWWNRYGKAAVLSGMLESRMNAEMQASPGSSSWCDDLKNLGKGIFFFFFSPASSVIFVERIWKGEKAKGCGKGTYSGFSKQFSFRTYEKVTKVKMTILNEKQVFFL